MGTNLPEKIYPLAVGYSNAQADGNLLPLYLKRYDRVHTRTSYQNDLRDFFGSEFINLELASQVTFVHINDYLSSLEDQGYKASTLKRRVAALRGFFDWLMALGALDHNPAHKQLIRRVRTVRQKDKTVVYLTSGQAGQLVGATQEAGKAGPRNKALVLTLLHCVLRRAEAAAMDVEHIRPLGHYWILDLPYTKGGADQYVKMPAHVVEEIEQMKLHYGIVSGPLWRSLSNNNNGGRLSTQSIYNIVKHTARDAGLSEQISAHSLRHTGCTLALEAGATLQQVQTHARHKNIETTMVYLHQRDKLRDSAADFIHIDRREP